MRRCASEAVRLREGAMATSVAKWLFPCVCAPPDERCQEAVLLCPGYSALMLVTDVRSSDGVAASSSV